MCSSSVPVPEREPCGDGGVGGESDGGGDGCRSDSDGEMAVATVVMVGGGGDGGDGGDISGEDSEGGRWCRRARRRTLARALGTQVVSTGTCMRARHGFKP